MENEGDSELSNGKINANVRIWLVVEKVFSFVVVACFVHAAIRSLHIYGIFADIIYDPKSGRPFLIISALFVLLSIPWMLSLAGFVKHFTATRKTLCLAATIIFAIPPWVYIYFVVD